MSQAVQTDTLSEKLRAKAVDRSARRILITDFRASSQETDLSVPPNCGGYGRIRHFKRATSPGWPGNPLPIDPAARALGIADRGSIEAQVFQNAACNWRCWYCFVPFELLAAKQEHAAWLSAEELISLYLDQPSPPPMIDLTGGQPDLTPEWIPWMMEAARQSGIERKVYLWSDDNLSNDFYFRFLTDEQRELVSTFANYGRVCCFKGFDPESFAFNTKADPALFDRQFDLFGRLVREGFDIYAYATFSTPADNGIADSMARFVDRLQAIAPHVPLRTVLLEVRPYTPVVDRGVSEIQRQSMEHQLRARDEWLVQLQRRFPATVLAAAESDITTVSLR